ncbi:MAG: TonB-dependent receptor [Aquabacterium sp.]|nr:TonB-dependent receptor [Aquabacterium sp.]
MVRAGLAALWMAAWALPSLAQQQLERQQAEQPSDQAELPPVTVSAKRAPRSEPHHVTVLTAEDIARSTATSVGELLSTEANLNLQSLFGHDKNATIDMRGMGATAGSNVLVILDGVRLNENDMTGADMSAVTLSQIQKIEVLRGGGAVRYGNGAVGGVIRITTRAARSGPPEAELSVQYGSYNSSSTRVTARASMGAVNGLVQLGKSDSEGFRDNGGMHTHDHGLELRMAPQLNSPLLDLYVRANHHDARYGLPGPLSVHAPLGTTRDRQATVSPLTDGGRTNDESIAMGMVWALPLGSIDLQWTQRDRVNHSELSSTPFLTTSNSHTMALQYSVNQEVGGLTQTLHLGVEGVQGTYARYKGAPDSYGSELLAGQAKSRSMYGEAVLAPAQNLSFKLGARAEQAQSNQTKGFNWSDGYEQDSARAHRWFSRSYESGVTWQMNPKLSTFMSWSQHFRSPNFDELGQASDFLHPQKGRTIEWGMQGQPEPTLNWSATAFHIRIQDEIYYGEDGPGPAVNRNYTQATLRDGIELSGKWTFAPGWQIAPQWTELQPRFEGTGLDIPLVPRRTISAQLRWDPRDDLGWTLSARHVGTRQDGNNSLNNRFQSLDSYKVVDTSLRMGWGAAMFTLGINNLFGEVYATQSYSDNIYLMPERTAYLSMRLKL